MKAPPCCSQTLCRLATVGAPTHCEGALLSGAGQAEPRCERRAPPPPRRRRRRPAAAAAPPPPPLCDRRRRARRIDLLVVGIGELRIAAKAAPPPRVAVATVDRGRGRFAGAQRGARAHDSRPRRARRATRSSARARVCEPADAWPACARAHRSSSAHRAPLRGPCRAPRVHARTAKERVCAPASSLLARGPPCSPTNSCCYDLRL